MKGDRTMYRGKRLFLDDTRDIPDGFDGCRDIRSAKLALTTQEYDYISLDYSLDDGTGLDIVEWMLHNGIYVPHINIHSSNILGRERMKDLCEAAFTDSHITMNMLPK